MSEPGDGRPDGLSIKTDTVISLYYTGGSLG